jgi:hypothetical protein
VQTESPQQESWQQESVATVSTVVSAAGVVLPPQDAKDTAAKAANMKTNFFIFLLIFKSDTINCPIKTVQNYVLFQYHKNFHKKKSHFYVKKCFLVCLIIYFDILRLHLNYSH